MEDLKDVVWSGKKQEKSPKEMNTNSNKGNTSNLVSSAPFSGHGIPYGQQSISTNGRNDLNGLSSSIPRQPTPMNSNKINVPVNFPINSGVSTPPISSVTTHTAKKDDDPFGNLLSFGSSNKTMSLMEHQRQRTASSNTATSLSSADNQKQQSSSKPQQSWDLDFFEQSSNKTASNNSTKKPVNAPADNHIDAFAIFDAPKIAPVQPTLMDTLKPVPDTSNILQPSLLDAKPSTAVPPRRGSDKSLQSSSNQQQPSNNQKPLQPVTSNREGSRDIRDIPQSNRAENPRDVPQSNSDQPREQSLPRSGSAGKLASFGMNLFQKATDAVSRAKKQIMDALDDGNTDLNLNPVETGYDVPPTRAMEQKPEPLPKKPEPVKKPEPPKKPTVYASPEKIAQSDQIKEKGNVFFKQGNYPDAEEQYNLAIQCLPAGHDNLLALFNNRASCRLKTGNYKGAIEDANSALNLSEKDVKAILRRANAYEAIEKYDEAIVDYKQLLALDPSIKTASAALTRIQRGKRQLEQDPPSSAPMPVKEESFDLKILLNPISSVPVTETVNVQRLREQNRQTEEEDVLKLSLKDDVDLKVNTWRSNKETNLRALLSSLETILWEDLQWKPVNLADLVLPNKVKINYMKAIAKLHPDKLGPDITLEQKMLANHIFSTLNDAWDSFKTQNNL